MDFHLILKPYVLRVMIVHEGIVSYDAKPLKHNDEHIFNGTIPKELANIPLNIKMFAFGGTTEYTFSTLFSKPFGPGSNVAIVNTHEKINYVFIDVPKEFWSIFKTKYLTLLESKKPKMAASDMLARGIDPQGKIFALQVHLGNDLTKDLETAIFRVNCYETIITKELKLC